MKPKKLLRSSNSAKTHATGKKDGFEANILRLVTGAEECQALQLGEIDAIIDPSNGHVILLPDAQAALLEGKARFRSLVELSTDGYWEQDQNHRFLSHSGAAIGNAQAGSPDILGKALWDLSFGDERIDWQTHRTQLAWRAIFRDLELRCVDHDGTRRLISLSGEPLFDSDGKFKGYRGITRDISDRGTRADGPAAERTARTILDALATQVCLLDAAGMVVDCNTAWRLLAATHRLRNADVSVGSNYLALCDRVDGSERTDTVAMAAGIRQVIAGERELFRYEYYCDALEPRWFMATVMRMHGHETARAIISYEDITQIKSGERLLRLECAVAHSLATAADAATALSAVIRAVCETQQWECGQYFRLDPASAQLSLQESWGRPTVGVARFLEQSRSARFRSDAGFAGRVCQSGEPLWVRSQSKKAHSQSLAHEHGGPHNDTHANTNGRDDSDPSLESVFEFPVRADGKVVGVLAFRSGAILEPDERLLRTVRSIGDQLGRFLQRQDRDDNLRRSELRFRRLIELSSDWVWEQDTDFRFTKFTGAGISGAGDVLGKTLWELPSVVLNDEEWSKHKSELQARWSFCDFEFVALLAHGQRHYYRISGEPLYDAAGLFVGFHGTGLDVTRQQTQPERVNTGE